MIPRSMWQANVATSTSSWAPIPDPATQPVVYHGYAGGGGGSGGNAHHAMAASGTNGQGGAGGQMFTCRCGLPAIIHTGAMAECQGCFRLRTMAVKAVKYAPVRRYPGAPEDPPKPISISSRAGGVVTIGDEVLDCRPSAWAPIYDPAPQPVAVIPEPPSVSMSGCRLPDGANVGDGLRAHLEDHFRSLERKPPPELTHCACGASFATVKRFTPYTGMDLCGDCYSAPRPQAPAPIDAPIDARIRDAREGRDEDPTTWTAGATPGWEWP